MNCVPDYDHWVTQFGTNERCSPFGGMGHYTNCTKLAETCYKGFVASPPVNTTYGPQVFYVGNVEDNLKFEECVNGLGQVVHYEPGFTSDRGCQLTFNSLSNNSVLNTNAAWPKNSFKSKSTVLFTYLAVFLCFTVMVAARPFIADGQPSDQLQRLGSGWCDKIMDHIEAGGQLRTTGHGVSGNMVRSTVNESANTSDLRVDYSSLRKRGQVGCKSFVWDYRNETQSGTERVGPTIDCRNCFSPATTQVDQTNVTLKSIWQTSDASAKVSDFSVRGLGPSYRDEVKTGATPTFSIGAGYMGYVAAYAPATVFVGRFTECDDRIDKPGRVFAIRNQVNYRVVNTNA
ncbi:hypothetical protein PSEUBRA_003806 [Kalmanozyma brasiliensis GHG001]|uniref:uncharacterized protein n=1 Tax=Kalmanozyma brasiliensis (strain GHG001) TaxID=1365824 RepID=UPI001CEAAA7A|nr:uncharacterized protein PSEUBRA_003806 [Kalmanozyma brasiliensis GHG001]KAF6767293.1 hypothetical protein PSEUBRA_003806 [Kalmanozyma brasiliensis GHG001]